MNEKEKAITFKLIALMAHVEGISEEQKFVAPISVNITDKDGKVWDFEYSPEWVRWISCAKSRGCRFRYA